MPAELLSELPSLGIWQIAVPAALFVAIALFELLRPRRDAVIGRAARWTTHAAFFLANAATARLMGLLVAVPLAANWATAHNFGLLNIVSMPLWAQILITFVIMDFAVWFQHMVMHKNDFLWRMHKVHHSDRHLDLTTALRFHPFEIVISTIYKSAWVALLGLPALMALAFELWLNGNALFNHSNIRLPGRLDRIIRQILVTPDMHLVHHSTDRAEHDSNYGFALTWWDRMFGSYLTESEEGKEQQNIGIAEAQDNAPGQIIWSFLLPFRNVR